MIKRLVNEGFSRRFSTAERFSDSDASEDKALYGDEKYEDDSYGDSVDDYDDDDDDVDESYHDTDDDYDEYYDDYEDGLDEYAYGDDDYEDEL